MGFLDDIIDLINTKTGDDLCEKAAGFHGLTELVDRNGKRIPMEICDGKGVDIVIMDDKYPVRIYHRIKTFRHENTGEGFGDDKEYKFTAECSMFGIVMRERVSVDCGGAGLNMAFTVHSAFPSNLDWEGTNVERLEVTLGGLQYDFAAIAAAEFRGALADGKINPVRVSFFQIDYIIEGYSCAALCDITGITAT